MPRSAALASSSSSGSATAGPFSLTRFDPRRYLQQYWPPEHIDSEDAFILRFLHSVYSEYRPSGGLLELGGGPVIDKYISASRFVSHIVHTDFSEKALQEVSLFQQCEPDAWDWQLRCDFVAKLESHQEVECIVDGLGQSVAQRVRDKLNLGSLCHFDLKQGRSQCHLSPSELGLIGVVSVHSVCECVAQTEAEWYSLIGHVFEFCASGTLLVMTANTNTLDWAGGAAPIQAVPLSIATIVDAVEMAGFVDIRTQLRSESGVHESTEMNETLALSAVKF